MITQNDVIDKPGMKKVNEKNDDFLMKICGFWIDFEADFKPSILKQDKGV